MLKIKRFPVTHWKFRDIPSATNSSSISLPWLTAKVPGHVHLDLKDNGVIPDPFSRLNERGVSWVDEQDWIYEGVFDIKHLPVSPTYVVFHGLDTVAEIELNDEPLGSANNMFMPYEFDIMDKIKLGENKLTVTFRSPQRIGRERRASWRSSGGDSGRDDFFFFGARSFVRKAQYMYGWDWGPELASCGIWKTVEIVTVPIARLRDWKWSWTMNDGDSARVKISVDVERTAHFDQSVDVTFDIHSAGTLLRAHHVDLPAPVTVTLPAGSGNFTAEAEIVIEHPELWWPRHHGPAGQLFPTLYFLNVNLTHEGKRIDQISAKLGLRTVELLHEPDADGKGEGFRFVVNGAPIFAKGANWIPPHTFPSTISNERFNGFGDEHHSDVTDNVGQLIKAAANADFNMLRVWGGGFYESDRFYDLCDMYGILVWQDFPFACAYYPDTGDYRQDVRREAETNIKRIRNFTSLALWCGNNENATMYEDKWSGDIPRYVGEHIYHTVLPEALARLDPETPYWPSSPFGGKIVNSADYGDKHNWEVWHGVGDWLHYVDDNSRFCSEFGFASSCGNRAWETVLADADKHPQSAAVRWHDKTKRGYDAYLSMVALHFPEAQSLDDLVYYTQINQAEALKCGVEHYRRLKGRCWGTLFWQLNDCWPVQSWSVIDSLLAPKAAYYWAKHFYAPVLLSLVKEDDMVVAHVTNDELHEISGELSITLETFEGEVLTTQSTHVSMSANGTGAVGHMDISAAKGLERDTVVLAHFDYARGQHATMFLAEPKKLRLPNPAISWRLDGHILHLSARRFAAYVRVELSPTLAAATDLTAFDNFFHMRAGEEVTLYLGYSANVPIGLADISVRWL